MNRTIKYRAWSTKTKKMNPDPLTLIEWIEFFTRNTSPRDLLFLDKVLESLIWMQFTGLLDKNGKEICEGDVVKSYIVTTSVPQEVTYVVHYKEGSFIVGDVNGELVTLRQQINSGNSGFCQHKGTEIIGNIHENPELIEK